VKLDVCNDDSVSEAVATVLQRAGRIDGLVNTAGIVFSGAFENHSVEEARALFETNTLGTFRMCRAVLPQMRRQGRGRIVNVSSLAGLMALPYVSIYSASKFAVEGMTESLRMEVERFGISVSLLEPGDFLTTMTEEYPWTEGSKSDEVYRADAERAVKIMEADCRASTDVRQFSRRLEAILEEETPAIRYTVGPWLQRVAAPVHRLIPNAWFEQIIRSTYIAQTEVSPFKAVLDAAQTVVSRASEAIRKV
jgi:NAD(P)-dependent dehydrogenase (short-subunit alcohol dehydrogenase family)